MEPEGTIGEKATILPGHRRLLFISHDASQTGAPLLLLELIRWLHDRHPALIMEVWVEDGGPLLTEFRSLAPTYLWNRRMIPARFKSLARLNNALVKIRQHFLFLYRCFRSYDLVYINSVAGCSLYQALSRPGAAAILHAHEMATVIKTYCGEEDLLKTLPDIDRVVADSGAVKSNLVRSYAFAPERIEVVYPWLADFHRRNASPRPVELPEDSFLIGGSGTLTRIKGADVWLETAIRVLELLEKKGKPPVQFVWLGAGFDDAYAHSLFHRLEASGFAAHIRFAGPVDNPLDYYRRFDLFFLSSREDPFPLVVVENGSVGTPVLCFDRGNGSVEVLDTSTAYIVPYLDVDAAAYAVLTAIAGRSRLRRKGEAIKNRFAEFTPEHSIPRIVGVIRQVLESNLD